MMIFAFGDVSPAGASDEELAFGLYRMSAVARAGYETLSEFKPVPAVESAHQLLLDSLAAMATAENDIKDGITNSDSAALVRGGEAAMRSFELLMDARAAIDPNSSGTQDTSRLVLPEATRASESRAATQKTPIPVESGVTLSNFNRIHEGMTYQEVVSILGSRGELISSSTVGTIKTEMYMWEGEFLGANMNAMFQDGKLVSKAQFGLE